MKALRVVMVIPLFALVTGCVCPKPSPTSSNVITLEEALREVKDGIRLLQAEDEPPKEASSGNAPSEDAAPQIAVRKKAGLLISEVQVTFNITAANKGTEKLGVDLAAVGIPYVMPKGSFERTSETGLTRGNQITFRFQNLLLAGKDTVLGISVTPITTTSEVSFTHKTAQGEDSYAEKTPRVVVPSNLPELYEWVKDNVIMRMSGQKDQPAQPPQRPTP